MPPQAGSDPMLSVLDALPSALATLIGVLPPGVRSSLQEIRVRAERPLAVHWSGQEGFVTRDGRITSDPTAARCVSSDECRDMLARVTRSSVYALEDDIRNGFVTLPGGHRCGLVGKAVLEAGSVKTIRHIAGFNLRVGREVRGAADRVIPALVSRLDHRFYSTLVISPPQGGKTTFLRDLARQASLGVPGLGVPGRKVGIIDERSEIAGCVNGVPQHDVGPRTDVLDDCPKAEGVFMMLRAMSPEVLVMDELGRAADVTAVEEATNAGVIVIASAHAGSLDEARHRPSLATLIDGGFFARLVVLSARLGPGTIEEVASLGQTGKPGISSHGTP